MNFLKVEHISTGYGKKQVLFDISFEIQKGDTVLLIGSNGSGKSTLLKTIYGLMKPWSTKGKIYFNGEEITNAKPSQLIKKGMVYIPQSNELFEDLSVKENLELCCMQTINKGGFSERLNQVFEQIPALKTLLKQECTRLSGGERKLLSLAMALINQSKLIMLDEPFAGVSPKNRHIIRFQLEKIIKSGISLILVEHRLRDVFELADVVIGLKLGELFNDNLNSIKKIKEIML